MKKLFFIIVIVLSIFTSQQEVYAACTPECIGDQWNASTCPAECKDFSTTQEQTIITPPQSENLNTRTQIPEFLSECHNLLGCNEDNKKGVKETFIWKEFIPYIIKTLLEIGSAIAVLMLVYSGIVYITMGSDEGIHDKATKNIMFVFVGLLFMLLSRAIISIVENIPLG